MVLISRTFYYEIEASRGFPTKSTSHGDKNLTKTDTFRSGSGHRGRDDAQSHISPRNPEDAFPRFLAEDCPKVLGSQLLTLLRARKSTLLRAAMAKRCHADDPASARRTARRRGPTLAEACIKLSACTDEDRDSAAARRVIEVMLEEEPPRRTRDSFACLAATTDAPARELSLLRLDEARRRGVAVLFEVQPCPSPVPAHQASGIAGWVCPRADCSRYTGL